MSRQINFLAERRKSLTKVEVQDRKIIRIASIIFGSVFAVFLIVFGIRFYFDRQLFQVREAQRVARAQILNDQSIERSFVIFVYKLTALANLTQDKQEKNEALNFFSNLFGPDVFVTQMTFLEKEKILSLKIQSDSVFSLREIFSLMNTEPVREQFVSVNPSDLTRTPQGNYEMVITAVVKAKPIGESGMPAAPAVPNLDTSDTFEENTQTFEETPVESEAPVTETSQGGQVQTTNSQEGATPAQLASPVPPPQP